MELRRNSSRSSRHRRLRSTTTRRRTTIYARLRPRQHTRRRFGTRRLRLVRVVRERIIFFSGSCGFL